MSHAAYQARYYAAHRDEINARRRAMRPHGPTPVDRFWARVLKTDTCWLWQGATAGRWNLRYGQTRWAGRVAMAHRVAYELLVGAIPDGLQIDHLCRNPLCVNPAHLEPVTNAENARRGHEARRTVAA